MNRDSILLLLVGFLLGFLVTYLVARERDLGPLVIRDPAVAARLAAPASPSSTAIPRLEAELEEDPGNFQLLVELGNASFDVRDFESAADYYARALELSPDNANLRTDLGTALYYLNRIDEAVANFERSLEANPTHPQTLFNLGVVLLEERNDSQGALRLWERLVEANPDYPQIGMVKEEIERLKNRL